MTDPEVKRIVLRQAMAILAREIKQIWEENLTKDLETAKKEMGRAQSFRRAIEGYGFPVIITAVLNPQDPAKPKVSVEVFEPKANMTEEERKIYNDWFTKATGLPPLTLP